jgi:alpha-tubulin suppressor-like RCC1 family protein
MIYPIISSIQNLFHTQTCRNPGLTTSRGGRLALGLRLYLLPMALLIVKISVLSFVSGAFAEEPSPSSILVTSVPLRFDAVSSRHVCGRALDGSDPTLHCFPSNRALKMELGQIESLFASAVATCATDDKGWRCWGGALDAYGLSDSFYEQGKISDFFSGDDTLCRKFAPTHVECVGPTTWSEGGLAMPADGNSPVSSSGSSSGTSTSSTPSSPTTFGPFRDLRGAATSNEHFCALDSDRLFCQAGRYQYSLKIPETPIAGARSVATDNGSVCVIGSNGLQCWDEKGEIAEMARPDWAHAESLIARGNTYCALNGGAISCVSRDPNTSSFLPVPVNISIPHAGVAEFTLGSYFGCARLLTGEVHCWGKKSDGINHPETDGSPIDVPKNLAPSMRISAGYDHVCSLGNNSVISCWGKNQVGQLNTPLPKGASLNLAINDYVSCAWNSSGIFCANSGASQNDPLINYPSVSNVHSISLSTSAGADNACALFTPPHKTEREVKCWGYSKEVAEIPPSLQSPEAVAVNSTSACALTSAGKMICWGRSQLDGLPGNLEQARKVQLSNRHACALDRFGLVCWGSDLEGAGLAVPSEYQDLHAVLDFAIGSSHTCVLNSDNRVDCWGANDSGQLNVPELLDPVAIAAYGSMSCATDSEGVKCWGAIKDLKVTPTSPPKSQQTSEEP